MRLQERGLAAPGWPARFGGMEASVEQRLILAEDKTVLMRKLGRKALVLSLKSAITTLPAALADRGLKLEADGRTLTLAFATGEVEGGLSHLMSGLMGEMQNLGLELADFRTEESSLEDIFVDLVREPAA